MNHAFGSACVIQNASFSDLCSLKPQVDYRYVPVEQFLPSRNEWNSLRDDYSVLILETAAKHIPFFREFLNPFKDFFKGPHSEMMSEKNKVIVLPVLHKNEQKYDEVVDVLDFYEQFLNETFTKANATLDDQTKILIGGDQLTRERFSGSKCLRAGGITAAERFEHLSPITFELFHLLMNYVKLIMKKLYNDGGVNDMGTMRCAANRILRSKVSENVNENYETNKDFIVSFTDAYIVEAVMEYFQMESPNDAPTANQPPDSAESNNDKKTWVLLTFGKLVQQMVWSGVERSRSPKEQVQEDGTVVRIKKADGSFKSFVLQQKRTEQPDDKVKSYAHLVLELGLHFKALLHLMKLPDRDRGLRLLKVTMIHFKANNWLSKYAYEIARLLVHQYCTLSLKEAHEQFYALFVNTRGNIDSNIPCDLQMEYIVKCVKKHLKHMFSNKTETFIYKRTSAIAAVSDIAKKFDQVSDVIKRCKKHSDRNATHDELDIINDLREVRPFRHQNGRYHSSFPTILSKMDKSLDSHLFRCWLEEQKTKFATELGN